MGRPALALLDQPELDVPPDGVLRLVAMVRVARESGTAVIWSTSDPAVWQHDILKGARRYSLVGGRLASIGEARQ
jgi:hypothetical protein